jgi:serine/threonine protein kinase
MTARSFGKYTIIEELAQGGMAAVFLARDTMLDRTVALKIIHPHLAGNPGFAERFRREARMVSSLRHPNIVQLYDFDVRDGQPFMVMEYLDGGSLKDRLDRMRARGETIPLTEIARLLEPLAGALDYAHAQGAIHRDIKPANILFTAADEPVITDFGVARMLGDTNSVTVAGSVIGSPTYMSPEQAAGKPVDARGDTYSLGVILYQMAAGRVPFEFDSPTRVMAAHLGDPTPPPREFNPNLPEIVQPVILRAMAKNPAYRFESAGELSHTFRAAISTVEPASSVRRALPNQDLQAPPERTGAERTSGRDQDTRGSALGLPDEPTIVETVPPAGAPAGAPTILERRPDRVQALRAAPTEIVRRTKDHGIHGRPEGGPVASPVESHAPPPRPARRSIVRLWPVAVPALALIIAIVLAALVLAR